MAALFLEVNKLITNQCRWLDKFYQLILSWMPERVVNHANGVKGSDQVIELVLEFEIPNPIDDFEV
jgi:hypothetical protein